MEEQLKALMGEVNDVAFSQTLAAIMVTTSGTDTEVHWIKIRTRMGGSSYVDSPRDPSYGIDDDSRVGTESKEPLRYLATSMDVGLVSSLSAGFAADF
ncbi:hypothetical protein KI688_011273 [Linnemannia hyalina]|uniref:Uncharacterized protein n=1 Tax=Linnemannia hyalina TaxID=64524 RepID=A0A9P7XV26_9FUNG|nr:hypothetical protein KI688_011273 [Linnemannia hyalina]